MFKFRYVFLVMLIVVISVYVAFSSNDNEDAGGSVETSSESPEININEDKQSDRNINNDVNANINEGEEVEEEESEPLDPEEAKEVAINFSKAFYEREADNPMKHVENTRPYVNDSYYEYLSNNLSRPLLGEEKTEVKSTDIYPVDGGTDKEVIWNVIVTGEVTPTEGDKYQEEMWYFIKLRDQLGEWKVTGVEINNE